MRQEPKIGEKVWIKPAKGLAAVPMPVTLRKNVTPADNKYRTAPLPKLEKARQVVWRRYWRRMLVRGEIEYVSANEVAALLKKRKEAEAKAKAERDKAAKEAKAAEGGNK